LRASLADDGSWLYERFRRVLNDDILSGRFAREWSDVQAKGLEQLEQMRAKALSSDIAQAEASVRRTT
jgi:ketol-acid reductoisomerase